MEKKDEDGEKIRSKDQQLLEKERKEKKLQLEKWKVWKRLLLHLNCYYCRKSKRHRGSWKQLREKRQRREKKQSKKNKNKHDKYLLLVRN